MNKNSQKFDFEDGSIDAGLALLEITPHPDGLPWSTSDIAFVCGCSAENIRVIEARAREKMKRALVRRGITPESVL